MSSTDINAELVVSRTSLSTY